MPIFSSAGAAPFPPDDRYVPTTEIHPAAAAQYAFYFHPKSDFRNRFNFDDCREFKALNKTVTYDPLDFSNQDMYYHRLFKLPAGTPGPKYYLCPWLVIPYELQSSGSLNGQYSATTGDIHLLVRPRSVFGKLTKYIKALINQNNASAAGPRRLELWSSSASVHATWDSKALTATPAEIDEIDCLKEQPITIKIDSTNSTFPYSTYIELRSFTGSASHDVMGRIYILFCEIIKKKAIFLDISEVPSATPGTNNVVNVKMLSAPESSPMLHHLNRVMEMAGLRYSDPGVSIKLKNSTVLTPGTSVPLAIGEELNKGSEAQATRVSERFEDEILEIDGVTWSAPNSQYLLVFKMGYVVASESKVIDGVTYKTITRGNSKIATRSARVFVDNPKTIAHECGHAIGLPHWFKDTSDEPATIKSAVVARVNIIGIFNTRDLYLFHDDGNAHGLHAALTGAQWNPQVPQTPQNREKSLRFLFFPRLYRRYATDDLMDYQSEGGVPPSQEQLRKHQVEQIRYFA